MTRGTLSGARAGLRALTTLQDALALDDLWTAYLANMDFDDTARLELDVPELVSLVGAMLGRIGQGTSDVRELRNVLDGYTSDEFEEAVAGLFADRQVEGAQVERNLAGVREDWELRGAVIAACRYIEAETPSVMAETAQQLAGLAAGLSAPGDFPPPFRCALFLAVVGAGIVGSIGPHGLITAPTLVNAVAGGALGWGSSGCGETLEALARHRR